MRQLFFALAFCLASCATSHADADETAAPYASAVQVCVFSAQTDDAVAACREATSRPCIEDDGGTTPGLIECYSAENDGWEHVMDFVAGELTAAFPESAALLADAQHNWQLFREQDCAFAQQRWGPGSGAQVEYVRCMATHAADRAVALVLVQRHPD